MDKTAIKILVAEDEEMLRDILSLVLSDEGYQVDTAANGAEAWELLNKNTYHLLATDLFMPVLNGFELILKTQNTFPSIKIMLISGGGKDIEAEEEKKTISFRNQTTDIDVFLKKPYSISSLLSKVENILALTSQNA